MSDDKIIRWVEAYETVFNNARVGLTAPTEKAELLFQRLYTHVQEDTTGALIGRPVVANGRLLAVVGISGGIIVHPTGGYTLHGAWAYDTSPLVADPWFLDLTLGLFIEQQPLNDHVMKLERVLTKGPIAYRWSLEEHQIANAVVLNYRHRFGGVNTKLEC